MGVQLKKLSEQVMVITGASSGIGLVTAREAARRGAEAALARFGRVDTWVNNAGVSIYGRILDTPFEDMRRLYETNLWGVVYGSVVAAEILRQRGGALINVGSNVG